MDAKGSPLTERERGIYTRFIEWLRQSWYGVPDSDVLLPYVAARYTPEEASAPHRHALCAEDAG